MTLLHGLRKKMYAHFNKTFLRQNWHVRPDIVSVDTGYHGARVPAVCAECERWFIYRVELKLCPVCCVVQPPVQTGPNLPSWLFNSLTKHLIWAHISYLPGSGAGYFLVYRYNWGAFITQRCNNIFQQLHFLNMLWFFTFLRFDRISCVLLLTS